MHSEYVIPDASALEGITWVKSPTSGPEANCAEFAALPDGRVAMRQSKAPAGPALVYSRDEIRAFLEGARLGAFDHFAE